MEITPQYREELGGTSIRVLEGGCGRGALIKDLVSTPGGKVTGIDFSADAINLCRRAIPGAEFYVRDFEIENFHVGLGTFDLVITSEVIEHLSENWGQVNLIR